MTAFLVFVAASTLAGLTLFVWDQRRHGRFRGAAAPAIDLFTIPPEIAGAAWSDTVDTNTVQALLTRLVLDGKIAAEVQGAELLLTLRASRASLAGYERAFVNALFVSEDTTDRRRLVKARTKIDKLDPHGNYHLSDLPDILAPRTFDLAAEIEEDVIEEAHRVTDGTWLDPRSPAGPVLFGDLLDEKKGIGASPAHKVRNVMLWVYVPLIFFGAADDRSQWERDMGAQPLISFRTTGLVIAAMLLHLGAMRLADRARKKVALSFLDIALLSLPLLGIALLATFSRGALPLFALMFAGSLANVLLRARSTGRKQQSAMREALQRAREQVERAIATSGDERWLPYAVAFGLGDKVRDSPPAFDDCGGVTLWNELAGALIRPIVTRSPEYD